MSVLILSTSDNVHADAVQEAVKLRGEGVVRVNFDSHDFTFSSVLSSEQPCYIMNAPVDKSISGVFLHHPLDATTIFEGVDKLDSDLIRSGWVNAIDWLERSSEGSTWVNKFSACRNAVSSIVQLRVALANGLRVPDTILTNDLVTVSGFAKKHDRIITKPGALYGVNLTGHRILANLIRVADVDTRSLSVSPCLFQEYIEKAFELRVHVVGDTVLACKIDSQECESTKIDWRNYRLSQTPHHAIVLDQRLHDACLAICHSLHLTFGILDIIITKSGDAVFLECNSQGHWLWIEKLTGLPITDAVAARLVHRSAEKFSHEKPDQR